MKKYDGKLTEPAIQEMHYLDGICYGNKCNLNLRVCNNQLSLRAETTRLYASMLVLTKICNKRYELPPQDPVKQTKNIIVDPGTVVVIPVFSIHQ